MNTMNTKQQKVKAANLSHSVSCRIDDELMGRVDAVSERMSDKTGLNVNRSMVLLSCVRAHIRKLEAQYPAGA